MLPAAKLTLGLGRVSLSASATGLLPAAIVAGGAIYLGKQLIDAVFSDDDAVTYDEERQRVLQDRAERRLEGRNVQLADTRRGMSRVFHRRF